MDASEFFAQHYDGQVCKELQELDEQVQVAWELTSVHPEHSPGPIADAEVVCRPHVNPTHYDERTQQLKPAAFDDAMTHGSSVDRLSYLPVEGVLNKAHARVAASMENPESKQKSVVGYSTFDAAALREVRVKADGAKEAPRRAYALYDASLDGEPEHAVVCILVPKSQGRRSAREELYRRGNQTFIKTDGA